MATVPPSGMIRHSLVYFKCKDLLNLAANMVSTCPFHSHGDTCKAFF
jgi:hypothetical protein